MGPGALTAPHGHGVAGERSARALTSAPSARAAFRRGQGGLGYPRVASPLGDVFTGELEDWLHHARRCWSVCVECFSLVESLRQHLQAPDLVARFNPRDPGPVVARDAAGVRALLAAAAALPPVPERPGAAVTRPRW